MTAATDQRTTASWRSGPRSRPSWLRNYQLALVALDGFLLAVSVLSAVVIRFPHRRHDLQGVSYLAVAAVVGLVWWASLALTRSYEVRYLGEGPEEFKRVMQAGVRVAGVLGVVCFIGKLQLSRGFLAALLPLAAVLLPLGRLVARAVLRRARTSHAWSHRVVVVGASDRVAELVHQLHDKSSAGFVVVGACVPERDTPLDLPEVAGIEDIAGLVARTGADTVAVTSWPGMTPRLLRELTYELEGPGVDLLVAPSLLNIAGSRVSIQPFAGLPLLQLQEAQLSGTGRFVKGMIDRTSAFLGLVLLSPVLLIVAVIIKLTSKGPVLSNERRLGGESTYFGQYRFRSHVYAPWDATQRREGTRRQEDRQLTSTGRLLQATYLEELPHLINVLKGDMSFVGPRALLPGRRQGDPQDQRRLLVKPGITGLAQTSGRNDQTADEAARLDQQYVDNWSLGLDFLLILKSGYLLLRGRRLS